ncbi:SusC/RagA family TonB-linked outer membrane protein [Bacteroidia bacterium]|nr:SusC/RagA family TonB-linked outer membrane protein [Bacteroidia bacterium]
MERKIKITFFLFMLFSAFVSQQLSAQSIRIGGIVYEKDDSPSIGATITVKGTTNTTMTDVDGKFSIIADAKSTLVVSYIGFRKQEIPVNNRTTIDVFLQPEAIDMEGIVIVGYGTQKKINLTGAVSSVNNKELVDRPVINLSEALQGTTPGLIIQQTNSAPGSRPSINIRGLNTMNNNDPLVLIDGIEGDIQNVAISDVEQISVLKDAASTAIYGSRASNGIILITTKKGSKDKQRISYEFNMGWQDPTAYPQVVDSWLFAELTNEAQANSGNKPKYTEEDIAYYRNGGPNYKWLDLIYHTAPVQTHNLSVTGGNDKTTYLISGGYLDQESMFVGPDYGLKRYNTRVNLSHQLYKNLKINVTTSYIRNELTEPVKYLDQIIRQSVRMPPFYPAKDENGNWTTPSGSNSNALARLMEGGFVKNSNDDLSGTITAEWSLLDGLKLTGMAGGRLLNNQQHTNSPAIKYPTSGSGDAVNEMKEGFNRTQNITTNLLLSYEKSIGQHRFSIMGGYSYEGETYRWFNTGRTFDDMKYDALGDEVKSDAVANSGGGRDFVMNSFFGRLNYNYADRYLFEFNIRDDISSKFAKGNRNAIFPSLSAAWRISEETFFEELKNYLPNVKLRGSWGLVGNNRIDLYQYLERVKANQSYMFGEKLVNTAVFESSNPDIRWETTEMANIALDLGLLNNSLNLTMEYFNNTTRDILVTLPISKVYGLKAPVQNGGIVNTWGWETSLEYRLKTGQVNHRFALNLSDSRNKVVNNKGRVDISGGDFVTIIQEGYPLWSYYGYKSDGFFQNQEEVDKGPRLVARAPKPGDIRYVDKNKDGFIKEDDDRFVLGNRFPRYIYGFSYGLNLKGIEFSMFWQGVGKRSVWISGVGSQAFANNFEGPVLECHTDRWTPDNLDATYPRLTTGNESLNNSQKSDFWIEDAAYLRLKNIQLGYTIPASLTQKVAMKKVKAYISLQNALTFSKMRSGWDPEIAQNNASMHAVSRVYSVGLNVEF